MTCSCPKCKTAIELDITAIPVEGSFTKCSACHANVEIRKESFAKRALYKGTEISCAECGNSPGTSIYCQSCHAIYPEILVVETSSAAKKQLGKLFASLNLLKKVAVKTPARTHKEHVSAVPAAAKGKGVRLPGKPLQLAVMLVVVLAIAAAGGYFWYQDKITTEYTHNYVRALMGMKTVRDYDINISNRVIASWRAGAGSSLTGNEQKAVASAKTDVDTLMQRMGKVPAQFTASNNALNKLHDNFGKLHTTATTPSGTSDIYAASVKKMDDEFMKSARELKSGLPEKISLKLNESSKTYKELKDF